MTKFKKNDAVIMTKYLVNGNSFVANPTGIYKTYIEEKSILIVKEITTRPGVGMSVYVCEDSKGNQNEFYETELIPAQISSWKNELEGVKI